MAYMFQLCAASWVKDIIYPTTESGLGKLSSPRGTSQVAGVPPARGHRSGRRRVLQPGPSTGAPAPAPLPPPWLPSPRPPADKLRMVRTIVHASIMTCVGMAKESRTPQLHRMLYIYVYVYVCT